MAWYRDSFTFFFMSKVKEKILLILLPLNIWGMDFNKVIFNNTVSTSNKIYCVSIMKISCLMLFEGKIAVYSEKKRKKRIN
jgi:hypothetical protein